MLENLFTTEVWTPCVLLVKLHLIIRHYQTLLVGVLLSSVGVLQTQPVPANPSAFFLAAQGQNDGLDSFRGQQSRREIREQKQTELRKRRGGREDDDEEEEGEKVVRDQGDPEPHRVISCQNVEKGNQATL